MIHEPQPLEKEGNLMIALEDPAVSTTNGTAPCPPPFDPGRMAAFLSRVMGDLSGTMVSFLCLLGDRLGLFKDLAARGPATSGQLAQRTGLTERYVREWLSGLACAGYLEYDPDSGRYHLPAEHAPALAQEGGPMFLGGGYQQLQGLTKPLERLLGAFRDGGGVPQEAYGDDLWLGMERMSATWFDNLLVPQWLPLVPEVLGKLQVGARVADVGCGRGRALIRLANAFPNSRFDGFDAFGPVIAQATQQAETAGVAHRVRFERRDVGGGGLPDRYDLVTLFDSLHDVADPVATLREVRKALKADGTCLVLEMNCGDRPEENRGPAAALLYGTSVLYNLPVSLARGGPGLGTLGLPESRIRHDSAEAGFREVRRLPVINPFNVLYELKA